MLSRALQNLLPYALLGAVAATSACGGDPVEPDLLHGDDAPLSTDAGPRTTEPDAGPTARPDPARPAPITAVTREVRRSGVTWHLPVVLFDDGWAALEAVGSALAAPLASRQRDPSGWAKWRKASAGYEYLSDDGSWEELGDEEYPPLPKGYTFALPYGTLSVSSSADSTFIRSSYLELRKDGTFFLSKSGSTSYEHLPTSAYATDARGSYAIDGYLLNLTYASGQRETRGIVSGGGDEWMIWIDDAVYCHVARDGDLECTER